MGNSWFVERSEDRVFVSQDKGAQPDRRMVGADIQDYAEFRVKSWMPRIEDRRAAAVPQPFVPH